MFWSSYFIPTSKETPADATVASHQLAIRAGLIRQVAVGSYTYLPLGCRVLRKIESIIREEVDATGAMELRLPALQPLSLWTESGRVEDLGDLLMRVKGDDWQSNVCIGPDYEEVVTEIARAHLNSYKQLPIIFFQINAKFRGEPQPKSGIIRPREFITKDAYSFDADEKGLDANYRVMYDAYCQIFRRCGLPFLVVEADSGAVGGSASSEFVVLTDAGEDIVAMSEDSSYAANLERAARQVPDLPPDPDPSTMNDLQEVYTPDCPGIEDVCAFLKVEPAQMLKTLVYEVAESQDRQKGASNSSSTNFVIACVRGDHEVNESKLNHLFPEALLTLCDTAMAQEAGFAIGYCGPHKVNDTNCTLVIDPDARSVANAVTGANKYDYHVTGFNWTREVQADRLEKAIIADIRNVVEGDLAPDGSGARLIFRKAIKIGHIFKLGSRYSAAMSATFLDENGKAKPLVMGCYGIGVNHILAAAIEAHNDKDGICWPMNIAPFEVEIAALDVREEAVMSTAYHLHDALAEKGIDVLLDNRDARPGFKFKDADLIGVPIRINVGKKGLAEGMVELKMRESSEKESVPIDRVIDLVAELVTAEKSH